MKQFTLYTNPNKASNQAYPYLLDVQTDLLADLITRLVIPVSSFTSAQTFITKACPIVEFENESWVVMTPQMASIACKDLGLEVGSLENFRDGILASLDFILTGI